MRRAMLPKRRWCFPLLARNHWIKANSVPAMILKTSCYLSLLVGFSFVQHSPGAESSCELLRGFTEPPVAFRNDFAGYKSLLKDSEGHAVVNSAQWQKHRQEIFSYWDDLLGPW